MAFSSFSSLFCYQDKPTHELIVSSIKMEKLLSDPLPSNSYLNPTQRRPSQQSAWEFPCMSGLSNKQTENEKAKTPGKGEMCVAWAKWWGDVSFCEIQLPTHPMHKRADPRLGLARRFPAPHVWFRSAVTHRLQNSLSRLHAPRERSLIL